jgi:ParB-like chromosome segregation protein Spo0J
MSVQFKSEHKRGTEYLFYPEHLVIQPELNGRHTLPDISELEADIERNGQGVPVTIRSDGGKAVLVKGFSRYRAIVNINKRSKVKRQIRCTYTQLTEPEAFVENITENRFRNATSEIDDAHNIARLMKVYAMTEEQIGEIYFPLAKEDHQKKKAVRWVRTTGALANLTPQAEKALREGKLTTPAARQLAKLSQEQQREELAVVGKAKEKPKTSSGVKTGLKFAVLKDELQKVIDTGKFAGIGGKVVEAGDDLVEFLGRLLG